MAENSAKRVDYNLELFILECAKDGVTDPVEVAHVYDDLMHDVPLSYRSYEKAISALQCRRQGVPCAHLDKSPMWIYFGVLCASHHLIDEEVDNLWEELQALRPLDIGSETWAYTAGDAFLRSKAL